MMKKTLFALLFLPISIFAQDNNNISSTNKEIIYLKVNNASSGYYNPATNMHSGGTFPSYNFRVGESDNSRSVGFNGSNLRPYLAGNLEALKELDTFKRKRSWMVGGIGIMAAGGIIVAVNGVSTGTGQYTTDFRTGERVEKEEITAIGVFGLGVMIGGLIVTGVNGNGATKHVVRAVEIYNKGLSNYETTVSLKLRPQLNPHYAGVGLTLQF